MAYPNGRVPLNLLVHLGGQIYLPPGTTARWRWAVAEGKRRWGVTFYITGPSSRGWDGWNGYRPLDIQRKYKDAFGNMAAPTGTSSHGGFYRGQEVFAIDVANWAAVTWSRFSGLMAEAGLRTNFVSPEERWHVGDFNNPWVVPAFAAPPAPPSVQEDEKMLMLHVQHAGKTHLCSLSNGVFRHFIQGDPYARIAQLSGAGWQPVSSAELPALLRTYGCDLHIWDIRGDAFVVLDPLSGKAESGGMWSAINAARAGVTANGITSAETAAYVKELAKLASDPVTKTLK